MTHAEDLEMVSQALALGADQHPSTHDPVFVWTDADAALSRIAQHHAELVEALRRIEQYPVELGAFTAVQGIARTALSHAENGELSQGTPVRTSTAQLDWEDHHGRRARPVRRGRLFLVGEWGWVEIPGPIEEVAR